MVGRCVGSGAVGREERQDHRHPRFPRVAGDRHARSRRGKAKAAEETHAALGNRRRDAKPRRPGAIPKELVDDDARGLGAHVVTRSPLPAGPLPERIRIVTWNVWFDDHRFEQRSAALLVELARRGADVIALQEVTFRLLAAILAEPWVRAAYQVSDVDVIGYDVVVLSRLPIQRMMTLQLPSATGR